jgi:hypothetical protein
VVTIRPAARFEEMIRNTYGLAQDGKTDATGMPSLLQLALLACEFDDTIRFTKPPRIVQRLLFSALAPPARVRGLRGSYPRYLSRPSSARVAVEPWTRPPEDSASLRVATVG